jgi:hypothetical protein
MMVLLPAAEHGFSAKPTPPGVKKFLLHPVTNVLYSPSNLGDNMAECKHEKQGMFSASCFYDHSIAEEFLLLSI